VEKNYYLNRSAKDAYRSYLLSYASHSLKHIFNVNALDLPSVSKGFGFSVPPRVNLNISATGSGSSDKEGAGGAGGKRGGGGFADHGRRPQGLGALASLDPARRKAMAIAKQRGSGHSFSASNPYGKREHSDGRQFTR
jgi:ATP-dependent RNA helicase DDX18/HAS1